MSTSKDPIAAFQQFAAQQQQQQSLDKYLSERAAKYGTTPRGAASNTGWTAGETLANPFAGSYRDWETDRKSTRLNSSHSAKSRMPSSA